MLFVMRNRNGIEIKKCCASCKFRQICSDKGRFCRKHQKTVKAGGLCEDWEMNPDLEHAGDSGGQVKCAKYLDYYRKHTYAGWVRGLNGGEPTAIEGVEADKATNTSKGIYRLDGKRLSATSLDALEALPHGIYIVDGKKVIK